MLRVVGLALILVFATTPTAAAGDHSGVAAAAREGVPLAQAAPPAGRQTVALLALPPSALRVRGFATPAQVVGSRAGLMAERRQQQGLVLPWRSHGSSALALPLTDRLTVGFGYQRVLGEDLWREFAEIGAMDYESHNVLLRAHWRF